MSAKIVAVAGSLRAASFNRKLLAVAVKVLRDAGAEVDVIDLKTAALPVYDGDIEDAGFPAEVKSLSARVAAAQGIVISTPEYNHSIPGGLKNFIDWLSRTRPQPFMNKIVAIMGATPGPAMTLRAQSMLRQTLAAVGALALTGNVGVARAMDAFDESGALKDARANEVLTQLMGQLVQVSSANPLVKA